MLAALFGAFKKAYSRFDNFPPLIQAIITTVGIVLFFIAIGFASDAYDSVANSYTNYRENHFSPSEHLQFAHDLCHEISDAVACIGPNAERAITHLKKVPTNSPEYAEAAQLLSRIQANQARLEAIRKQREQEQAAQITKQKAQRARLLNQSTDESFAQMERNMSGQAHDPFLCSTSTENMPIMSFDYGHYWWNDDGRCAAQQQQEQQAREEAQRQRREHEQRQREQEQRQRDDDAQLDSYWPTTLRVDTDMDSFWLPNEERTCQTYPDDKGHITTVACNATGSHRDHNIPVKFWGGVDRNTVSDWKCRRESDEFVCRAIN